MTCDEALELLSAALDGELSPEERNTLDAHLAECEACAALFDELAGQSRLLRELDCEAPAGLSERILSALPEQTPAKGRNVVHWRRWGTLAACLALVVWAGVALPGQLGRKDASMETAQMARDAVSAVETEESAAEDTVETALPSTAAEYQEDTPAANSGEAPIGYSIISDHMSTEAKNTPTANALPIHGTQYLRVTWSEELSQPEAVLITTPEELSGLLARLPMDDLTDATASYDANWFGSARLVAVTLAENSGSVSHTVEGLLSTGEGCQVVLSRQVPETGTCDMAGWLILIETGTDIPPDGLTVVFDN